MATHYDIGLDEFLKGTWKEQPISEFGTEDTYANYLKKMEEANEQKRINIAKSHGLTYDPAKVEEGVRINVEPVITLPDYDPADPFVSPEKEVTPDPEARPEYEGPEYYDPRTFDPTPSYMTLRDVQEDEFVENRIASMLDKGSPLFRQAAEAMARRYGTRGPRAQEAIMEALFKVAQPIAMADALMLERDRTLHNTAYYRQMDIRMQGALQQALSHIAGGYQIQATIINDITNQWKAQLAADIQTYGIDVGAATQVYGVDVGAATKVYGIDVGAATANYTTDVNKWLGMEGLKVKMAEVLAGIEDNAEATAFLWDMVFGDNALNPSEWIKKWKDKWGDQADSETETETADVGNEAQWKTHILTQINSGNCKTAQKAAKIGGSKYIAYFNSNAGDKCLPYGDN
jgi:hypothetical protein